MSRYQLHRGDSRELLKAQAENSVDSIVTDPPYELGFMGKSWDSAGVARDVGLWREALRVAKPGAWLLAFGGTRTYHRLACAIEDAGWELRDSPVRGHMHQPEDCPWLMGWMFASGFPKSHNGKWGGTALKPAWEPIVCARKPLIGTVEENWQEHGVGGLNIDGCRIGVDEAEPNRREATGENGSAASMFGVGNSKRPATLQDGRWPANVIHDGSEEVTELFPAKAGQQAPIKGTEASAPAKGDVAYGFRERVAFAGHNDTGSAARFFYCAKASQEDRNEGCIGLPERAGGMVSNTSGQHITRRDGGAPGPRANHHPTVKPTDLMRWLVRLVTPKGGTVLDLFTGSGSTGKASMLEGLNFIGFDLDQDESGQPIGYIDIARARIEFALRQGYQPSLLEDA